MHAAKKFPRTFQFRVVDCAVTYSRLLFLPISCGLLCPMTGSLSVAFFHAFPNGGTVNLRIETSTSTQRVEKKQYDRNSQRPPLSK
jgi:hypothetical protein